MKSKLHIMTGKLIILSDTHDNGAAIRRALRIIEAEEPEAVIHCGDIVSPRTLDGFKGLPIRFVFGNCDLHRKALNARASELGFDAIKDELEFSVSGLRFFAYHGTEWTLLEERIDSGDYDFVFHGHSHEKRDEYRGRTRIINPGALYRAPVYSLAVLEPAGGKATFIEIPK